MRAGLGEPLAMQSLGVAREDPELEAAGLRDPRQEGRSRRQSDDQSSAITSTFAGPPGWAASHLIAADCSSLSRAFAWRSRRYPLQSTRGFAGLKRRMSKPSRARFSGVPTNFK